MSYQTLKLWLDCIAAALLFIPLFPVMLLLAILICLDSKGAPIYCQSRVGKGGKTFTIYKFRTMKVGTPVLSTAEMQGQQEIPYTRLGPILRKTNLDELPQLFNILKGEMSFVGPRPALHRQHDVNTLRRQLGVDAIRPGITGLAQVMGRDELDTETKVGYDAEYCRRMSLALDLYILWLTLGAVLTGRGNK